MMPKSPGGRPTGSPEAGSVKEHCHNHGPQASGPQKERKYVQWILMNPVVTRKLKLVRFVSSLVLIYHRVLQ